VTGGLRKQYNEDLYCSPTNNKVTKARIWQVGHIKHMVNMSNAYKFSAEDLKEK
jgi:hypothetical protein